MTSFTYYMRPFTFFLALFVFFTLTARQVQAVGPNIGILGDSNTDEYRADDNRAGDTQYAPTTLNWLELLVKKRDFNAGSWGTWGEPRRSGYKYNWARSAAISESMISTGQHTGLAQQIAAGEIQYVVIFIGTNDFHSWNGTYDEVYNGTLSGTQLQQKVSKIVGNITTAVDTLKQAGNVKILLVNFADPGDTVAFISLYPDATKRQRVTNAIIQINQGLTQLAQTRQIVLVDLFNFADTILARVDSSGNLTVGGEKISVVSKGHEPHHLQLNDGVGHVGTVGNGLIANYILASLNSNFGLNIPIFSDTEILNNAGIFTSGPTSTRTPSSSPTKTMTPMPNVCAGDISGDSIVDLTDYSLLVQNFLKSPLTNSKADLNGDGRVDLSDYSILVSRFLKPCS